MPDARPAYWRPRGTGQRRRVITAASLIPSNDVEIDRAPSEQEASAEAPPEREVFVRPSLMRGIARNWWTFLVRGLLAIAFGLAALVWPDVTLLALVALFGAFALLDGVISILFGITGRESIRWWMVIWGLVGVAAGIGVFLWPTIGALALVYVIAAWAILTGAMEIAAAITWRREIRSEWVLIVAGVLSVMVGGAMALFPGTGAVALVWLIGAYAVVFGVLLVIVAFRLRDLRGHLTEQA